MESLFKISSDLDAIFYEIEENGGEITPEIEEKLALTQENFEAKLQSYINAIKKLDSTYNECKVEIDRIKKYSKSKELNKEKLIKCVIEAIDKFGDTNNRGIKFIELNTGKVQIRNSKMVDLNEILIQAITNSFFRYFQHIYDNGTLCITDVDIDEVVKFINEDLINNPETSYLLYIGNNEGKPVYRNITVDDVRNIKVNISFDTNIVDFCQRNLHSVVQATNDVDWICNLKGYSDKTNVKRAIEDGQNINIAELIINKNLTIK